MSLVETICKELGIKVGEVWLGSDGLRYRISSNGDIRRYAEGDSVGHPTLNLSWADIVKGELRPAWRPKTGETCYGVNFDYNDYCYEFAWDNLFGQEKAYMMGLVFKTREEAIATANKMLKALEPNKQR